MYSHPGNRPRYLNLAQFRFPINAILSAAHRITGFALVISLIGYLALTNLIILHDQVTLESVSSHWIVLMFHTAFWVSLAYHWLSGLRHLLAEHFLAPATYAAINSKGVSFALIAMWLIISIFILVQVWS